MGGTVGVSKGPRSDINITPLVDVVLVLLIIFMVLTPLMEKEMGVRLPDEPDKEMTPPPPEDMPQQVVLRVKEDGRIFANNEALTDANMVDRLKAYYRFAKSQEAKLGKPVIFFDADDKAKYKDAIKALDAIRDSSQGWTIGMMTEKVKVDEAAPPTAPGAPGTPPPETPGAPAPPETPAKPQ